MAHAFDLDPVHGIAEQSDSLERAECGLARKILDTRIPELSFQDPLEQKRQHTDEHVGGDPCRYAVMHEAEIYEALQIPESPLHPCQLFVACDDLFVGFLSGNRQGVEIGFSKKDLVL